MAKDLSEQLSRLGHKAELLTTRFATLKSDNAALRERILDLQAENRALKTQNERLQQEVEFLRMSGAIAPDSASARDVEALISDLVREIDACVADLMKDI